MAKKGISRIVIAVFGIGVLIAVIVPVMLFVFDVDLDNIAPQEIDTDPFEVPIPVPVPPIIDPTDPDCIDDVIEDGTNNPPRINCLPDEPPIVDPVNDPMVNMTETSDDPPIQQVCDELNLFCGTAKTIQLEADVVKIDSTLQRFNETFAFDIPFASLFVEETTDIDFRNGFIELDLNLKTDPDTQINADGTFNIKVGDLEIFPTDAKISGNGLTDQNGELKLQFTPLPLEILSDNLTFDFNAHFDKFVNEAITKVSFIVKSLDLSVRENIVCITTPCIGQELQRNGLTNQTLFSVDIFRDDIQIFITDTEGNQIRSYPQDDRFTVTSIARAQGASYTCIDPTCPSCPKLSGRTGYRGTGCSLGSITIANHPAPSVSSIKLFDANDLIINAGAGTGLVLDELLFRNANYSLTSPYGDFGFMTPKSQKNYAYSCFLDQAVDYNRVSGSITNTIRPVAWDFYVPFVTGSTFIVCNFPK